MRILKNIIGLFKENRNEKNSCSLERFLVAQEDIYTSALTEVKNGLKVTHWIWFIFPQLKGLGKSETSCYFGIEDIEEARAYLKHPVLGIRLREITTAFLNLNWVNPIDVFGQLDAMKVLSCMTLFNEVAEDDLFAKVMDKHYHGKRDKKTLNLLGLTNSELLLGDFSPKCKKCGFPLDVIELGLGFGDPTVYECKRCQCTFSFGETKFIDCSGKEVNFNSYSLERFLKAQEDIYTSALTEVKNGLKVTHWIWFIFPQLKGLGKSETSCHFGIEDIEEAREYLKHPVLGVRLREITTAFLNLNWVNPVDVFGRLDAMKVLSCMTLFNEVAEDDLFAKVMDKHYHGKRDKKTLNLLGLTNSELLLGAIAGDMIGSVYEFSPYKGTGFPLFSDSSDYTDDTVMTVANAEWLLTGNDLVSIMQIYGRRYSDAGYGGMFYSWLYAREPKPYNSWGNGSAMRVSPIGWAFETLEETLEAAKSSAEVTHNHPEGIKGAQATAACVYLARKGKSKKEIKEYVESVFGYNLSRSCNEIRPLYRFDESCQGTVPESIIAFLESTDFESAIRLTVSLGGDADTMGAITGGIAEAFYGGVPEHISKEVLKRLPEHFIDVMQKFHQVFV